MLAKQEYPGYTPLRLKSISADDIVLTSACIQDMCFPLSAVHYHPETESFMCLGNRFYWEGVSRFEEVGHYYRVHSSLKIECVTHIQKRGFQETDGLLNLLMLSYHEDGLHMIFSGQKELKLTVSDILVTVRDLQRPWITHQKPDH